ncbi:HsmA family protein [Colwellia sp. TT2012]|uniref:HsmA family protein n=1 Tax=Colwellia sp. TT2012 TaxID=1720342 RepID=UPI00070E5BF8|nr:HsmA family protein [Colwellia sp. TT2012]
MTPLILSGAIFFTLALIFYSIGIWNDYYHKKLKMWHLTMFGLGVITDTIGTIMMYLHVGHLIFTAHSISGFLGLFLMIFHFCWAFIAIRNNDLELQKTFHRFSILVWAFWMISYISGLYLGISGLGK